MDLDLFVSKQLRLLELERDAEIEEKSTYLQELPLKTLQQRGVLVQRLRLDSHRTSLYGRCVCTFHSQWAGKVLPSHRITTGDIVGVCEGDGSQRKVICSGVADQVNSMRLQIAFESNWEALELQEESLYSLLKLTNDVTYKRIKRALNDLQKPGVRNSPLVSVFFGQLEPSTAHQETELSENQFLNGKLNTEQREAVNFALKQKEVAIVHGPPGTGKTTTLVEIILQALRRDTKVLVCAPSNVAVDNLVEHLTNVKPIPRLVRLGHPSRLLPQIQGYSLDALLDRSHHATVLDDIRKEIEKLNSQTPQFQRQQQNLRKELRERERAAEADLLKSADIILSTLTAASSQGPIKHLQPEHFGLVVIDECSQATEAACWIALPRAQKCIIAGDHLQLPPTIISDQAAAEGFSVSLMERLCDFLGDSCTRMLCTQYRMHQHIMDWASDRLYERKLKADPLVAAHILSDLPGVEENETTSCVLLLVDTAGCSLYETVVEGEESKANPGEAGLVCIHVSRLIDSGLDPSEIAVITPYNLQVEFLRQRLSEQYPTLEIQSVDGFQGREKEAVVLTLVRSNDQHEIGFLAESRRINVAVTRARRHLAVICDTDTVGVDPFLQSLTDHISTYGEVHTAHQYTQELQNLDFNLNVPSQPTQKPAKKSSGTKEKDQKATKQKTQKALPVLPREKQAQPRQKASEEELIPKFQKELQDFLNSPEAQLYSFSSQLTSFERRVVHMLCEQLGLVHISKDEGENRFIEVSKKPASSCTMEVTEQTDVRREEKSEEEEEEREAGKTQGALKSSGQELKPKLEDGAKDHPAIAKPGKKAKKKKAAPPVEPLPDEDDLDTLLAATVHSDNTCSQHGCTTSIALISQTCLHCRKRWCFKHSLPEVHGCGDAAKQHARLQAQKGPGPPKVDAVKRVHMKRNLDKTLSKMAQQRKPKREESKK